MTKAPVTIPLFVSLLGDSIMLIPFGSEENSTVSYNRAHACLLSSHSVLNKIALFPKTERMAALIQRSNSFSS